MACENQVESGKLVGARLSTEIRIMRRKVFSGEYLTGRHTSALLRT